MSDRNPSARESLSALADGEASPAEVAQACAAWRNDPEARARWHEHQLIGDVLLSQDLAVARSSEAFLQNFRGRLAQEPVVLAPSAGARRAAAPEAAKVLRPLQRRAWTGPIAVAASFVAVDCSTLQENLFESEVFGHERGSFTGADRRKEGLVEVADRGTVFLDEIGEVTTAIQAKLLRILETGTFRRLGGTKDLRADVRFVAATNRDLSEMVKAGTFRADLYYRLSRFILAVPPLRERGEDIVAIAESFVANRSFHRTVAKRLGPEAIAAIRAYPWPGNVRELKNVVERAVLLSGTERVIDAGSLGLTPPERRAPEQEAGFRSEEHTSELQSH